MAIIENKLIGNTLLVTINNPSKRNSMIIGFHDELQSTIKMGEENKDVNSIIITGAGDFFCAGGDLNGLKTRRSMTEDERYNALGQLNGTIQAIYDCSKPIISAIEGGAAGAGVSLAMACDLVVMSEHTFFSLAYVKIGLTPDGNATKFLSETMPRQMLSEMAMIGGKIDASRLYQICLLYTSDAADDP